MKFALIALLVGVCGLAVAIPNVRIPRVKGIVADKVFLEKQKDLLRLLMHVHQPNKFLDQVQIATTFDIESSAQLFTNQIAYKEFVRLYRVGGLKRNVVFSVLNDVQRREVISLFHLFYYARSYDVFYKIACWARDYVNEGMFVYALTVAVLHRPDCRGIILPAPYEIYPYYFINHDVIKKAQEYKLQNFALFKPEVMKRLYKDKILTTDKYNYIKDHRPLYWKKVGDNWDETRHFMPGHVDLVNEEYLRKYRDVDFKDDIIEQRKIVDQTLVNKPYVTTYVDRVGKGVIGETVGDVKVVVIPYNYTGWYLNVDKDQKLTYFTEDIGLNSYYFYFHTDYPFWMGGSEYGLNKDRRGELYYYFHQQLLARYYLERLSNGLGKIDLVDIHKPVTTKSFICTLQYENGLPFPMRPKNVDLIYDDYTKLTADKLKILEKRILDAIDSGFVITEDGQKVNLYTDNGINVLGNLIHGNKDSVNRRFYSYIHVYAKLLLGYGGKPINHNKLHPSVLELYSTALRDPIFYSIYKKIVYYFLYYKKNLPTYTYNDLLFPGVKIENIDVDKLITYFDYYDVELNNAIYTDFTKDTDPTVIVKTRMMRLNHKPFTTRINVVSDKTTKVTVRLFLGPKYDVKGHIIDINDNRINFVEIDKFIYDLKMGKNVIERNSRLARHTVMDRTSYYTLYRKVMLALQGTEEFIIDNTQAHCGFPNRLLLPKGKKGGMVFQVFAIITPYTGVITDRVDDELIYSCGIGSGLRYIDNLPLGYPLDRKIDYTQFFVPNMYFKDVTIYHKHVDDVLDLTNVHPDLVHKKGIDITY